MTEEQAKLKWCPEYRAKDGTYSFCLGRECMMWRWERYFVEDKKEYEIHGFCGLAGTPSMVSREL